MCAARHGHLDLIGLLLEFGAEVDAQDKVSTDYIQLEAVALQFPYIYRPVALL